MDVAETDSDAETKIKEPIKEPETAMKEPKGKVMDLSDLMHLLKTMEVHIEKEDGWKLGTISGHRLFMKSETFTAMLQSSTVEDNQVTFTFHQGTQVLKNDVEMFDRMLKEENYVKILSSESVFDDFRNPGKTDAMHMLNLSGTALSPGVLTLIDYFELDGLKSRIVELTNKNPTLERILSLDGMQHVLPWMGYKAANVVAGRIAQVSFEEAKADALEKSTEVCSEMLQITDDLNSMRLDYDTLQSVTAMLAYMLKTMSSTHYDHRHQCYLHTPPGMVRHERPVRETDSDGY